MLVNALWLQQLLFLAQMAIRQYYSLSVIQITLDCEILPGEFTMDFSYSYFLDNFKNELQICVIIC